MVAGASQQCLWHLALTVLLQYYVRLFPHPHRRFGLFQFVAMSTLVRVALPVFRIHIVSQMTINNSPPCCSSTVKVLESLTPDRMSGFAFPLAYQHMGRMG